VSLRSDFDRSVRVLACPKCGAPVEVPLAGDTVACPACGTRTDHPPLDETAAIVGLTTPPPDDDDARIERLRAQDGKGLTLPTDLARFFGASTSLLPAMQAQFAPALAEVRAGADTDVEQRLFFIAYLIGTALYPGGDDRTLRCVLESTIEATSVARYAQMLRGTLAGAAVRAGDLIGAQDWLNACEPYPNDLYMDTARRVAACNLATAKGDWATVLDQLGDHVGAVPIGDAYDEHAYLLQANALEHTGREQEAVALLTDVLGDPGVRRVMDGLRDHHSAHLHLCPTSYPVAAAQAPTSVKAGSGGIGRVIATLGSLVPLLILPVMVLSSGTFLRACAHRPYKMALARTNACPKATDALGSDIGSTVGLGCGNLETSGDQGHITWNVPVSGSAHRGTLHIGATETGGEWTLHSLDLHTSGQSIDVLACTPEAP